MSAASVSSSPSPLVVGIAASHGGAFALEVLVRSLQADSGAAMIVVVPAENGVEATCDRLRALTPRIDVVAATEQVVLAPDTLYVVASDVDCRVHDDALTISAEVPAAGTACDALLRSIAASCGPRGVGLVLSGTGVACTAGMREIAAAGGLTIAQDPTTASQPGMPRLAIDAEVVDLVLAVEEIPTAIARYAQTIAGVEAGAVLDDTADVRRAAAELSDVVGRVYGFDISELKDGTLRRRLRRRMALVGIPSLSDYLQHVKRDEVEQAALARDLLIRVTSFFRDPEAFAALRTEIVRPTIAAVPVDGTLRLWVPACATGEEAYSLTMLFLEEIEAQDKAHALRLQVFATDVDHEALRIARAGIYPDERIDALPVPTREAFFGPAGHGLVRVLPRLRDLVSFAIHDLCSDPPFSRMDLVSCRNLLIYLRPDAQQRVLRSLHFALRSTGHLFLGSSESTGPQRDLFGLVSKTARIFRPLATPATFMMGRARIPVRSIERAGVDVTPPRRDRRAPPRVADLARDALLDSRVPPSVVIGADGQILFAHGDLSQLLHFPKGEPQMLLLSALREDLVPRVRAAIVSCRRDEKTVVAYSSHDPGDATPIEIVATPAASVGPGAVVLSFRSIAREPISDTVEPDATEAYDLVEQLERELKATREDLRATVEELESSNEELIASNEEAASMNEELQSANEELEATGEELRSLNAELSLVNAELRAKIEQVERASDDLENFFASTKIGILFLDAELRIMRMTPAAQELLRLGEADTGRRVGDLARELLHAGLVDDARTVLDTLIPVDRELYAAGRWLVRRVLPYRTTRRQIEGVVITFVDITEIKQAGERVLRRERQQRVIARLGQLALDSTDVQDFAEILVAEVRDVLAVDGCAVIEEHPPPVGMLVRAGTPWSSAHAVLSLPVRGGSAPYGVIGAWTREQREFGAEDRDFLQASANLLAGAVDSERARRRLAMERAVAQRLVDARSLETAAPAVLDVLAQELQTEVGELWLAGEDDTYTLAVQSWRSHPRSSTTFDDPRLQRGEGIVAQVAASGQPRWFSALSNEPAFVRRDQARALDLVFGLAIPIVTHDEVVAVITAFGSRPPLPDPGLLHTLEAIGRSLGEFERRARAEAVRARLAALVESSDDAIIGKDLEGVIVSWNRGAQQLYGYTAQDVVGQRIDVLVPEDRRAELEWIFAELRRGCKLDHFDTVRRRKDGTLVDVSITISSVSDPNGRVIGYSAVARDTSARRRLEHALREADRQKDQFLAMLGHELRNPLAVIRSACEWLSLRRPDDPEVVKTYGVLDRQVTHIAKLVDGLLDVSRIVQGKIVLDPRIVDLLDLLRQVLDDRRAQLRSFGLQLSVALGADPLWVRADPVRLAQVFDNLVANAIQFTPPQGRISITATSDASHAVIRVVDTGAGIEASLLPLVFEPFRQAAQELDRASGGLGLGLALVKGLLDLHGGDVVAESAGPGQGSTFTVRLPLQAAPPVHAETPRVPSAARRILLVEDNEDAAILLGEVLRQRGHDVEVAYDGPSAMAKAKTHRPDAVVCDIGLPGKMSGYDVARAMRSEPELRDVLLVALTGYARQEDREQAMAAGFDAHVTKPADSQRIETILASHVAAPRPDQSDTDSP